MIGLRAGQRVQVYALTDWRCIDEPATPVLTEPVGVITLDTFLNAMDGAEVWTDAEGDAYVVWPEHVVVAS